MFLPTTFKLTSRKPFITCCSIYTTKTPAPHLLFHSFSVNILMHSISRLSLYFLETCYKSKIWQMDVDFLHLPISLPSSLTSSPAHSFLPIKSSYSDLVFSSELHSQHLQIYNPPLAPTLSSSTKGPCL